MEMKNTAKVARAQLTSAALHLQVTPAPTLSNTLLSQVLPDSGPGNTYSFRRSLPSTSHVLNKTLGVVKSIKRQRTFLPPPHTTQEHPEETGAGKG